MMWHSGGNFWNSSYDDYCKTKASLFSYLAFSIGNDKAGKMYNIEKNTVFRVSYFLKCVLVDWGNSPLVNRIISRWWMAALYLSWTVAWPVILRIYYAPVIQALTRSRRTGSRSFCAMPILSLYHSISCKICSCKNAFRTTLLSGNTPPALTRAGIAPTAGTGPAKGGTITLPAGRYGATTRRFGT